MNLDSIDSNEDDVKLGNRTNSVKEWEAFKKSSEWLDLMDYVNLELEQTTNEMMKDNVNQKDFKIARDKRSAFSYLKELPDMIMSDIADGIKARDLKTNIVETIK